MIDVFSLSIDKPTPEASQPVIELIQKMLANPQPSICPDPILILLNRLKTHFYTPAELHAMGLHLEQFVAANGVCLNASHDDHSLLQRQLTLLHAFDKATTLQSAKTWRKSCQHVVLPSILHRNDASNSKKRIDDSTIRNDFPMAQLRFHNRNELPHALDLKGNEERRQAFRILIDYLHENAEFASADFDPNKIYVLTSVQIKIPLCLFVLLAQSQTLVELMRKMEFSTFLVEKLTTLSAAKLADLLLRIQLLLVNLDFYVELRKMLNLNGKLIQVKSCCVNKP